MKTIRIFISSPGDVAEEREKAREVIRRLQRRYIGKLELVPVLWEEMPLEVDAPFQQGIETILNKNQGIDLAVFILWSRLGSPLGKRVLRADGTQYRSGTEREFDLMLAARAQAREEDIADRPSILAYFREDDAAFKKQLLDKPTDAIQEALEQSRMAREFIREHFYDPEDGTNKRAYTTFETPATFAHRLRVHLQARLDEYLREARLPVLGWDLAERGAPYRGLAAFDVADEDIFFGREQEVADIQVALERQAGRGRAFVLLLGASGSGKSSLARAGVIPAIRRYDPSIAQCRHAIMTPGEHAENLMQGLARTLTGPTALPELLVDDQSLADLVEVLEENPLGAVKVALRPALRKAAGNGAKGIRLVLLVDQLEELFTHPAITPEAIQRFALAVEALVSSGQVWVLATLRSDFYGRLQQHPQWVTLKEGDGQYDVLPLRQAHIHRVITEPAWLAGLEFEEDPQTGDRLDQRILNDALRHPEALPLLQYTLRELFEQRRDGRYLTFSLYDELGGVEGALGRRAEEVWQGLPEDRRERVVPRLFRTLVTIGEDRDITSRPIGRDQWTGNDAGARQAMEAFVQARLLIASTHSGEDRSAVVRLAHEALIHSWPRLSAWLEESREHLQVRARLESALGRWKEENERDTPEKRPDDFLLPEGKPLADAQALEKEWRDELTPEHLDFIARSTTHHEARRKKRLRLYQWASAVFLGLALLAMLAGGTAWHQRNQAIQARDLAATAREQAEELIGFMTFDMRDKLNEVGRLDLMDDMIQAIERYHQKRAELMETHGEVLSDEELRRRSVNYTTLGDFMVSTGNLPEAEAHFRMSHEISETLVARDLNNTDWQRDLSISHDKLGDVMVSTGNLPEAEAHFRKALEIAEALAARDPKNTDWQHDLSVSHNKLGDVMVSTGNVPDAEAHFRKSNEIFEDLAARDPNNTEWQRDLSASHNKLDGFMVFIGNLPEAEAQFRKSLEIFEALAARDPDNTGWQRDLSFNHMSLGDVMVSTGNLPKAEAHFRKSNEIFEVLVAHDPNNTGWQRDLFVSHERLGDVMISTSNLPEAETHFRKALEIAEALADRDLKNAEWQRDLFVIYAKMGLWAESSQPNDASTWWKKALNQLLEMKSRGILLPSDEQFIEYTRTKAGL